jgi:hypothetical protein
VAKTVDKSVDKDIHRSATGYGRGMDSNQAAFLRLQATDIEGFSRVLHKRQAPHNHSNNLILRI